jgi:hypothetical protein
MIYLRWQSFSQQVKLVAVKPFRDLAEALSYQIALGTVSFGYFAPVHTEGAATIAALVAWVQQGMCPALYLSKDPPHCIARVALKKRSAGTVHACVAPSDLFSRRHRTSCTTALFHFEQVHLLIPSRHSVISEQLELERGIYLHLNAYLDQHARRAASPQSVDAPWRPPTKVLFVFFLFIENNIY